MGYKMKGSSFYGSPLKSDKDRLQEIKLTRDRLSNKKSEEKKKETNTNPKLDVKKYVPGEDGPKVIAGHAPGAGVINKVYKTYKLAKHAYNNYKKANTPVNYKKN